ncbi:MAG: uL15 family ribosomal protein [Clostridia bacterium]
MKVNNDYLNQHILIKELGAKFVYRKMPKEIFEKTVTMQDIVNAFPKGGLITLKTLRRKKMAGKHSNYLKVVDAVPVSQKYTIIAHKFGLNVVKNVVGCNGTIICIAFKGGEEPSFNNILR